MVSDPSLSNNSSNDEVLSLQTMIKSFNCRQCKGIFHVVDEFYYSINDYGPSTAGIKLWNEERIH